MDKSMQQIMRAAMKRARPSRAMPLVTRIAGDKEGEGNGNKGDVQQRGRWWQGNSNGNKGGR
jgi:hypothetical protein